MLGFPAHHQRVRQVFHPQTLRHLGDADGSVNTALLHRRLHAVRANDVGRLCPPQRAAALLSH